MTAANHPKNKHGETASTPRIPLEDLPLGLLLGGEYELLEQLTYGEYNVYYRAFHQPTQREVTVKILQREKAQLAQVYDIFVSSARLTARLEHPHIDIVYDVGIHEDRPFLVRRKLSNGSIRRLLREQRQISVAEKRRILREVADALDFAHSQNVIHANLKPSNILFDSRDRPYVLDFMTVSGMSSQVDQGMVEYYHYMPLEQLKNEPLTPQSDIFSLASTAFIFLCGVPPFEAQTMEEHITARLDQQPRLSDHTKNFSPEVDLIMQKSLHPDPHERHQTATEFTTALWNALQKTDYHGQLSVFISHSDVDTDITLQIADSLDSNQIQVWVDKRDLAGGQVWEPAIRKAIVDCDKFVVILSPEAVESRFVQAEIDFALEKQKPVIPILHRPCEVPLYIRSLQRVDFSRLGYSRGFELLVRSILA